MRGGRFDYTSSGGVTTFHLDGLKWTDDLAVSGTLTGNPASGAVDASLTLLGASTGTLQDHWTDNAPLASAAVSGALGGHAIVATMVAP